MSTAGLDPASTVSDVRTAWPQSLRLVAEAWFHSEDGRAAAHRERAWVLLHGAVALCVRSRARTLRCISSHDVQDIAAQKALDLMRLLDARAWDPTQSSPEQVRAYVFSAAGNAVLDFAREQRSEGGSQSWSAVAAEAPTQETAVDGQTYADAILGCLTGLPVRNRRVWYFRVILEMRSEQIGRHPGVRLKPGAVDALLFRLRAVMRRCLVAKGVDSRWIPPGTFACLWESMEGGAAPGEPKP